MVGNVINSNVIILSFCPPFFHFSSSSSYRLKKLVIFVFLLQLVHLTSDLIPLTVTCFCFFSERSWTFISILNIDNGIRSRNQSLSEKNEVNNKNLLTITNIFRHFSTQHKHFAFNFKNLSTKSFRHPQNVTGPTIRLWTLPHKDFWETRKILTNTTTKFSTQPQNTSWGYSGQP